MRRQPINTPLEASLLGGAFSIVFGAITASSCGAPTVATARQADHQSVEASPVVHERLSAAANISGRPVSPDCQARINRVQWEQDVLHATDSAHHVDNCSFDDSIAYVHRAVSLGLAGSTPPDSALAFLAAASHTVQDFYFHSNYVELSTEYPKLEDVPIVELWTEEGKAQVRRLRQRGLVSGTVAYEWPKRCPDGTLTHSEMAKDKVNEGTGSRRVAAWGITLNEAAVSLAEKTTRAFWAHVFARAPELARSCETSNRGH